MVSAPDNGCICSLADGSDSYFLPWEACDKYVAVNPSRFSALANYISELERLAKERMKVSGSYAAKSMDDARKLHQKVFTERKQRGYQ